MQDGTDSVASRVRQVVDDLIDGLSVSRPQIEVKAPWGLNAAEDDQAYVAWSQLQKSRSSRPTGFATGPKVVVLILEREESEDRSFRRTIESVGAQTLPPFAVWVFGDGRGSPSSLESSSGPITIADESALLQAIRACDSDLVAVVRAGDLLVPGALATVAAEFVTGEDDVDLVYADDDEQWVEGARRPRFKPDWLPDLLLTSPYLGPFLVMRRALLLDAGGVRMALDEATTFDLALRASERARGIRHIPVVLCHRLTADEAHGASRREQALAEALLRRGIDGHVELGPAPETFLVRRRVRGSPLVTAVIPFRDKAVSTLRAVESLVNGGYDQLDLILVDNGSSEPESIALRKHVPEGTQVIEVPGPFNWSAINNAAVRRARGELFLFLNNDVAGSGHWVPPLVEQAQREDVGAVGARLLRPDGALQHAGMVLGIGIVEHILGGLPRGQTGYCSWDRLLRPWSAVTGACLMSRRDVFDRLDGFDEHLAMAFNDVDYCMRVNDLGLLVMCTPLAELVHAESLTRGSSGYFTDYRYFLQKWDRSRLRDDPHYSPCLTRLASWCALRGGHEDGAWEELLDELQR